MDKRNMMAKVGCGVALAAIGVGMATARPAATGLPATQALLTRTVAEGKAPGIVAGLGVGDAPTSFASAGSIAWGPDAAKAGPDSLWRVYSMTKPITATAAMILVDEGKLKLDEPISTYLPAFAHPRVMIDPAKGLESRSATTPITLRFLLTHTAGLAYGTPEGATPIERDYKAHGIMPMQISPEAEARMRPARVKSLAAFADAIAAEPLISEPGTHWSYSAGVDLTGRLIEVASGMSFDRFVTTRIFAPLGMTSSFWTVPGRDVGRFATNYVSAAKVHEVLDPAKGSVYLTPPAFPYGGAGVVSSARDYDRFLHMLQDLGTLGGHRILKRETAMLMMSNLLLPGTTFGGVTGTPGRAPPPGGPTGFGAGGSVYVVAGPDGFPGAGTYGWGGAAGSNAWVDPVHHARGVLMMNVMGGVPGFREGLNTALTTDERAKLAR